jgi:hypothetical protein
MSWLDTVPVCTTAYAYQADLICEDCAAKIMDRLDKKNVEDDGTTDTYPQESPEEGGGESDSASFCGSGRYCVNAVAVTSKNKVGCPLGNALTDYGANSLVEMIHKDMLATARFSRRIGRLLEHVWSDYTRNGPTRGGLLPSELPASLRKLLAGYHGKPASSFPGSEVVIDCNNVYLIGKLEPGAAELLRCPVSDEGEFDEPNTVAVPLNPLVFLNHRELLETAVAGMYWD